MVGRKNPFGKACVYLLLAAFLLVFLFPMYWMVISSFKTNGELMKLPPNFAPSVLLLQNYERIFSNAKYLRYLLNSVIVASATVAVCLMASLLAGYSLSRFRFPFRKTLMTILLSVQMFPVVAILISLYSFFVGLRLNNTYPGLILADITMSLPLAVWMLKSFFDHVPRSLDESACIDGAGRLRTMLRIVVPLVKPGMLAVGIYTFLQSWDDYLFGLVLMNKQHLKTLPVGIAESFMGEFVHDYAGMMTMSVIASLPILLAFIFFQKYMVAGLTGGAVKE